MNEDIKKLAEYCDQILNLRDATLGDEYFYQSLPLCVIDAVYSIGVRYSGTRETVIRYCEYFELNRIRNDRTERPPINTQESIEEFLDKIIYFGIEKFTNEIFRNKQRTSTQSGILKSEAVFQFASVLKRHGVNYLQEISKVIESSVFEKEIRSIPGQTSGISLGYFFMLSGSEDFVKPDRHILAFLQTSINKEIEVQDALLYLRKSCQILKSKYHFLTPRLLDHTIWNYQREEGIKKMPRYTQDEDNTLNTENLFEDLEIGPYNLSEIVLCSADAKSQKDVPDEAGWFFPKAKWVGAVRNAAEKLGCRFVIITTGHGLVEPHDFISPYDQHINKYETEINEKLNESFTTLIGKDQYKLMLFYAGGVPREPYLKLIVPILKDLGIDLITFGRPNMFDAGKIADVINLLTDGKGTSIDQIKKLLKRPERLEFFSNKKLPNMYGAQRLKKKIVITENSVECPVLGCPEYVERQRNVFRRKPEFQCQKHKIYISATTFEYPEESDNFLWTSAEDQALLKNIKKVKRESRMARDNSEDALSWNVFRFIEKNYLIEDLLMEISAEIHKAAEIIYWSYSKKEKSSWSELDIARLEFGEKLSESSEPDLIISTDKAIFFIEAKFTADNKTTPSNLSERKKYLTGGDNWFEQVFNSGYESISIEHHKYKLMRFWLLGTWLSDQMGKAFYLVNLVREDREKNIEDLFKPHIKATTTRKFLRLSWEYIYQHILSHAQSNPDKDRFVSYFENKTIGYNHRGELEMAFSL